MKSNNINVLIIEENNDFRSTLRTQVKKTYPMAVCEEATSTREAMEKINRQNPDIIFADISISSGNNLEIIKATRKMCPHALIISMTHENNPEYERAAVKSGANYNIPMIKAHVIHQAPPQTSKNAPENITNKRKSKRFKASDVIYVNLKSTSGEQWGKLLDISKDGLSLSCFASNLKNGEYADLSIFPSNDDFALENIRFRTVCDLQLTEADKKDTKNLWRRGIQFKNLSPIQEAGLNYFLENYTMANA